MRALLKVIGSGIAAATLLLVSGAPALAASGPVNWGPKCGYTVTTGPLNIRSSPGTGAKVVDTLSAGTQFLAYRDNTKTANGYTWRFVTAIAYAWGAGAGWVATQFISGPDGCGTPANPQGKVVASPTLNVRSASGAGNVGTGSVIASIPNGAKVDIGCWANGPSVTGPFGSTKVWDALFGYWTSNGAYHSLSGWAFVSDAWVDSGGDTSGQVVGCF